MRITAIISVIICWVCTAVDKAALKLGSNDVIVFIGGTVHQGYGQRLRSEDVFLHPLSRTETIRIPENQIRAKVQVGSAMPTGLTAVLKREQLRDLIRFFAEQGRD